MAGGLTRRNVVKAAGVAGLFGVAGTGQASGASNGEDMEQLNALQLTGDELDFGGRRIVGDLGYDTVQAAWEDAEDGDVVYVHSSYDARDAGEEFPIVIDQREKEVTLTGGHPTGSEINAEHAPDKNVVELYGAPRDRRNTPMIRNLKIVGGNIGLQVVGAPNASFAHLTFYKCNSHGAALTTTDDNDAGSYGTRWYDCEAWHNGGNGFRAENEASAHGTTFIRCNATWNGWNGNNAGVLLEGYSSVWYGGTIQMSSDYGINVRDGGSQVVRDSYFEGNGIESSVPVQLRLTNTMGALVEGCYFMGRMGGASWLMEDEVGHDNVARAINLHHARGSTVRSCTHRWHSAGFVSIQGGHARDNDIYESTHYQIGGGDDFLIHDNAIRTRSNGVIREQDLRNVDGVYECDRGIHDGSGSAPWGPAVWNGSDWVSLVSGEAV